MTSVKLATLDFPGVINVTVIFPASRVTSVISRLHNVSARYTVTFISVCLSVCLSVSVCLPLPPSLSLLIGLHAYSSALCTSCDVTASVIKPEGNKWKVSVTEAECENHFWCIMFVKTENCIKSNKPNTTMTLGIISPFHSASFF